MLRFNCCLSNNNNTTTINFRLGYFILATLFCWCCCWSFVRSIIKIQTMIRTYTCTHVSTHTCTYNILLFRYANILVNKINESDLYRVWFQFGIIFSCFFFALGTQKLSGQWQHFQTNDELIIFYFIKLLANIIYLSLADILFGFKSLDHWINMWYV